MAHSVQQRHFIAFTSSDVKATVGGVEAAAAPVAGTAEVTLDVGKLMSDNLPAALRRKKLALWRVDVLRATGASGTNFQPQVYDTTGAGTGVWATKYLGASTAAATRFDVTDINAPLYSGTDGKLFFKVNGDASDTFDYAIWFEVLG